MRSTVLHIVILASVSSVVSAQTVPATIAEAEAEGAGFAHADPAASVQSFFTKAPFGGSGDRRCVRRIPDAALPGGSWRSGEFIVRGGYSYSLGLEAGKEHKILWIPLHGAALHGTPLVVRAVRLGHPADSIRFNFAGLARGDGTSDPTYGYPSSVLFPTAGQWLVVATANDDWGCFVLDVPEATDHHGTSGR